MNSLFEWKSFMIGILLWITAWDIWDYGMNYFTFARKYSQWISFVLFVLLTLYVFHNKNMHWKDL